MKIIYSTLTLILALTISACTSQLTKDIQVESDIDPKVNFSGYNSYMWAGYAAVLSDPDKLWIAPGFDANAEIKFLIDRELRARNMTETSQNPDVIIGYALGVDMANIEYKQSPDQSFKTLEAVPKGALILLMNDAKTGLVVWASTATAEIQGQADENAKKRLKYAVKTMLETFPK